MPEATPEQWLEFAKRDLDLAVYVNEHFFAHACLNSQQAVEKSLKAFLVFRHQPIPKIHSLPELLERCARLDRSFAQFKDAVLKLDKFYQPTRYPDLAGTLPHGLPNKADADSAIASAKEIYEFINKKVK
jgi:HEPN domain-containing protein